MSMCLFLLLLFPLSDQNNTHVNGNFGETYRKPRIHILLFFQTNFTDFVPSCSRETVLVARSWVLFSDRADHGFPAPHCAPSLTPLQFG